LWHPSLTETGDSPSIAQAVERSEASTEQNRRIAGSINVNSGAVIARQRSRFNVKEMYRHFRLIEKHYPQAQRITIALDNWPVHFHAYVREELLKRQSRIELLPLPTYAPWTNPTEKLWLTNCYAGKLTGKRLFNCMIHPIGQLVHLLPTFLFSRELFPIVFARRPCQPARAAFPVAIVKNRSCLPPTWTAEELSKRTSIERFD
jgi:hypothetical protein